MAPNTPGQKIPEARYANCFRVGYTEFEIMIDFAQCGESDDAPPHSRIIVLPVYADQLALLLTRSLEEYRVRFGGPSRLT